MRGEDFAESHRSSPSGQGYDRRVQAGVANFSSLGGRGRC